MALDTFTDVWNRVLLRCPAVGPKLAQDFVRNAFRRIAERRRWSWLIRYGQFTATAVYTTGTVTVTRFSTTVTGSGTVWTGDMVGRQFRIGSATPIYTISRVDSGTSLELDAPWGAASQSAVAYEIYQCFFTAPSDFHSFVTVWDPNFNYQLYRNFSQNELNAWDAQRSNRGQAYLVAWRDYSENRNGVVGSVLQVLGAGPDPVSAGTYNGANDAIFTIEVTTGGVVATAVFRWKKDSGSYTSAVTTSATAQDLTDGVQIYWPTGATYVLGDLFVIRTTAAPSPGLPRYEIWPHQTALYVYPFLYETRPADLNDQGAVLPRYIRGDVLLELALAGAAEWPGPENRPNPYFSLRLAEIHQTQAERFILELERQDDEVFLQDAYYAQATGLPFAPFLGDAAWLQSHAI